MYFLSVSFYGAIGAMFGSFVTFYSYRMFDTYNSLWSGSSACPSCRGKICWKSLVPIFSFIMQKGKCSLCKARISWRYPIIEIAQALFFMIIYMIFGDNLFSCLLMAFSVTMLIHIVTDIEHRAISVVINCLAILLAIAINITNEVCLIKVILSSLLIAATFWFLGFIVSWLLRKPALGFGDVEIVAALALLLQHPVEFIPIMAMAGTLGILYHCATIKMNHNNSIPFAPPLIIAFFIEILFLRQKTLSYLLHNHHIS